MPRRHVLPTAVLGLLTILGSSHLVAAEKPAADYRLTGPHLLEADGRSSSLTVADLNGDGRADIAAVSNDKSILRVFYRNDEKAEEAFTKEEITLDRIVRAMEAVDVNGDGRIDLVLAGAPSRLAVMYQTDDGRLQKGQDTDLEADRLVRGDLTGDGRDDLLVLSGQRMRVLPSTARGVALEASATFFTSSQPGGDPLILDIDGDGKNDIVFQDGNKREDLVIRPQSPDGGFPAEFRLSPGLLRSLDAVPMPSARGRIAAIHGKTRQLLLMELAEPVEEPSGALAVAEARVVGFDPDTFDSKSFSATADVDGDGRLDLLVAMPGSASIRLVSQTRTGSLRPAVLPSLKGLRQILPWPVKAGAPAPILLLSTDEKTIGVARVDEKTPDSLRFPKPIPIAGEPRAMAIADLGKGGGLSLLVAETLPEKKSRISALPGFDPDAQTPPEAKTLFELPAGGEAPTGLFAADLNRDGRVDLAVFFEYEDPKVLIQNDKGVFDRRESTGLLEGMMKGAKASDFFPATLRGAKSPEVFVVKEGFVRAFHLDDRGEAAVSDQFNGRNTKSRLRAARVGNLRGKETAEVAVLDAANKTINVFGVREKETAYTHLREILLDDASYQNMECFDLDGDNRDDLILVAPDRISIFHTRALNGAMETLQSIETPVEDGGYGAVRVMELVPGGPSEVATIEVRENVFESFALAKEGKEGWKLKDLYRFRMFDSESSLARRVNMDAPAEPRDLKAGDLNGDGKPDLVALMHDFIGVYYRE